MASNKKSNNSNSKESSAGSVKSGAESAKISVKKSVMVSKKGTEKIVELAAQIAKDSKSYNDWVWLAAEAELKARSKKQPSEKEIRSSAEHLFSKHLSIPDLQWKIAEHRLNESEP